MDRRVTLLVVVSAAVFAAGAGAFVMSRRQDTSKTSSETASCGMPIGKKAASRLPSGTIPLPPAERISFTGKAVCGSCSWGIGAECNTMLWDKDAHHVVAVLPNEKLSELQKLTGT